MSESKLKIVAPQDDSTTTPENDKIKKTRTQRRYPSHKLRDALVIGRAIVDNNAGRPYDRLSLADSLGRSPDSSVFRTLLAASSGYGLTQGGEQAAQISLTELGASALAPKSDKEEQLALIDAAMKPELFRKLYEHFDQSKVPAADRLRNTLIRDYQLEATRVEECLSHFLDDGKFVGLIRSFSGVDRVAIEQARQIHSVEDANLYLNETVGDGTHSQHGEDVEVPENQSNVSRRSAKENAEQRVFITHGKNKAIVEQLKELLTFGKFKPIVAEEQETPSKPVPDKVLESMRSCFAGVIHVESELELLDREGNTHRKINENVLIEIGAAMALYQRNFILLVRKGVQLPSNLQGLYRCEYESDKLDLDAAMKLLKTFNEFK